MITVSSQCTIGNRLTLRLSSSWYPANDPYSRFCSFAIYPTDRRISLLVMPSMMSFVLAINTYPLFIIVSASACTPYPYWFSSFRMLRYAGSFDMSAFPAFSFRQSGVFSFSIRLRNQIHLCKCILPFLPSSPDSFPYRQACVPKTGHGLLPVSVLSSAFHFFLLFRSIDHTKNLSSENSSYPYGYIIAQEFRTAMRKTNHRDRYGKRFFQFGFISLKGWTGVYDSNRAFQREKTYRFILPPT